MDREKRENLEALRQKYSGEFPAKQLNAEINIDTIYTKEQEIEDREYVQQWRSYHEGKIQWLDEEFENSSEMNKEVGTNV